jgi:putative ABC transport system ATP-binding protein
MEHNLRSLARYTRDPVTTAQLIRVEDLTKVYHLGEVEVHALRGVTLSIASGEFIAVMGASGSGKSTFMNILGCLDRPTSGRYLLDGSDVSMVSPDERAEIRRTKLGFVFQSFNLLSRTSAVENVELPLVYSAVSRTEQRVRALQALQAVGLAGREHHLPSQLSGGQQQRVAIARALVNTPAVILADEPTGNLDTTTSEEVMTLFSELNRQGITVIIVTHEADIASFTRRRIVFRDGVMMTDERVGANTATQEKSNPLAKL